MQIVYSYEDVPPNASDEILKKLETSTKEHNLVLRLGLYLFCITAPIWLYYAFQEYDFDRDISGHLFELSLLLIFLFLMPFIHELVHLIARPWQIWRSDTYFIIDFKKPLLEMGLAIAPGGTITREGYIWMSLLPLLVLTILPFIMIATSTWPFPVSFGIFACANISYSSMDIFNAYRIWKRTNYGDILSESQKLL